MALGAAVQVDAVGGGFEDVADGDAIASDGIGTGFDEGQKAVFACVKDLQGAGLVEEAVLAPDGCVVVTHNG